MKAKVLSLLAGIALAATLTAGQADATSNTYIVKKGDTLWKIASAHKLSVDELKTLNNLTVEGIKANQQLIVTKKTTAGKKPAAVKPGKTDTVKSVTVAKETSSTHMFKTPVASVDKPKPPVQSGGSSSQIMEAAAKLSIPLLDTPYVWAGVTPDGFDCSGFIYYVFKQAGLDLPRYDTLAMFANSTDIEEPAPGDLVFFENTYRPGISHAGIYAGDGNFIHAGTKKVELTSVESPYWKDKLVGYKRFNQLINNR